MDRIEAMKAYKVRQEQKAKDDADATERHRAELATGIRSLKDRIQKLIDTANACIENGIPIKFSKTYSNTIIVLSLLSVIFPSGLKTASVGWSATLNSIKSAPDSVFIFVSVIG